MSRGILFSVVPRLFVIIASIIPLQCPRNEEDAIMLRIYHTWNIEIERATLGTDISPNYLAALISLESHPPGNASSSRFESSIYKRLLDLKHDGRRFGIISRRKVSALNDEELREMATSYGLTQIMGYHCLYLGCSIEDLKGEYHLQWAVAWMEQNYRGLPGKRDWEGCFRIHNTGHPAGSPARKDYVERGLIRMDMYARWRKHQGNVMKAVLED